MVTFTSIFQSAIVFFTGNISKNKTMNLFNNLRISFKLLFVFSIVIILTCVLGLRSITKLSNVNDSAKSTGDHLVPELVQANVITTAVFRVRAAQIVFLGGVDDKFIPDPYKYQAENIQIAKKSLVLLQSYMISEEGRNATIELEKQLNILSDQLEKAFALVKQGQTTEGHDLLKNQITDQMRAVIVELDKLTNEYLVKRAKEMTANTAATYENSKIEISLLILLMVLASIVMVVVVARSIASPLRKAVKIAQNVAKGDLTDQIDVRSKDETGQLMSALNDMNINLRRMVSKVRSGSMAIETASSEIAAGNLDLSNRTESQASSLEETASAMEELTSTVKQNADNAKQANQLANSASVVAEQGGDIVRQVVSTMSSIDASSKKIVDIISVIDGIAFQTNILALNAAVEAARAGEQGRGFAVVASEVRNLAQRSAGAAKEIKSLIDDSVSKVGEGTVLVDKAGATMTEVVASIKHVTDIVAEITVASSEQSTGIEQVNQAVTQMDEMMQQNAALVEEASAATQSLKQQVNSLVAVVDQFKVDESTKGAPVISKIEPKDIQPVEEVHAKKLLSPHLHSKEVKAKEVKTIEVSRPDEVRKSQPSSLSAPKRPAPSDTKSNDDWEQF